MKILVGLLVIGGVVVACVSFDLDGREFRCDPSSNTCDPGQACSEDGYCIPVTVVDGATGDVPSNDGAIGEVCNNNIDDDNDNATDCADSECAGTNTCGFGCVCSETGVPSEQACGDGIDNDGRDGPDCLDPDCAGCRAPLRCCPDGRCDRDC